MEIKKGQIVAFTEGKCSDYCLMAHMRAVADFNTGDKVREFIQLGDEYRAACENYAVGTVFIAWLIHTGIVEPLDDEVQEWHIGQYNELVDTEELDRRVAELMVGAEGEQHDY